MQQGAPVIKFLIILKDKDSNEKSNRRGFCQMGEVSSVYNPAGSHKPISLRSFSKV